MAHRGRGIRAPTPRTVQTRTGKIPPGGPFRLAEHARPGLDSCVRALWTGDVLVVWKLDRLGRTLAHLVNTVQALSARGVGLRVLTGQGHRSTPPRRPAAACSASSRRWPSSSRTFALSKAQVRLAQAAMAHRDTSVSALCRELGITPVTLYRYVGPPGQLREQGQKILGSCTGNPHRWAAAISPRGTNQLPGREGRASFQT